MALVFADLHIHSALSPCGDDLMTPNNIVNMAMIKGLDVIAVADHNNASNLKSVFEVAKDEELLVIPAMEVTVKEDAHILCYFKDLDSCISYSEYVYKHLLDALNNEAIFGKQQILDAEDEEIGKLKKLLINTTDIRFEKLCEDVSSLGGVVVPAHVDKKAYSLINNLGFIPPGVNIKTLEVSKNTKIEDYKKTMIFGDYNYITSSDAHILEDMFEKNFSIDVKEKSIEGILDFLKCN